jgi:hypothetical protein
MNYFPVTLIQWDTISWWLYYTIAVQCTQTLTLCITVSWSCGESVSCLSGHAATSLLPHCLEPTAAPFPFLEGQAPLSPKWLPFPQDPHTLPSNCPLQFWFYPHWMLTNPLCLWKTASIDTGWLVISACLSPKVVGVVLDVIGRWIVQLCYHYIICDFSCSLWIAKSVTLVYQSYIVHQ